LVSRRLEIVEGVIHAEAVSGTDAGKDVPDIYAGGLSVVQDIAVPNQVDPFSEAQFAVVGHRGVVFIFSHLYSAADCLIARASETSPEIARRVFYGVLDIAVPEVVLNEPRIGPLIG
jgi:hypothetical protein